MKMPTTSSTPIAAKAKFRMMPLDCYRAIHFPTHVVREQLLLHDGNRWGAMPH